MRLSRSIKFKAAFLLTVFTLNTLISFACSVGIDMGFNHSHHADEPKQKSHSHAGKHSHASPHKHSHEIVAKGEGHKSAGQKDNCCNEKSVELQKLDKSSHHSPNPIIKTPVFVAFLATFPGLELKAALLSVQDKSIIPQYYPPPDRRILLQSFQI